MDLSENARAPVATEERQKIDRNVLIWLNKYPDIPVSIITAETQLAVDYPGMALSAFTNAYISKPYIYGGYQAEYSFAVIYRIKPGKSIDARLSAMELLNRIGDWCRANKPDLGGGINVLKVAPISRAEFFAPHGNGDEDYHIMIKITYEANETTDPWFI